MPRQKTAPTDYPQAVLRQIEQLAQNINIARKRRGESQAQWAKKLGVSQPTMARIERGDPSVAMATYVMCIWLINPAAGLADLIAPVNDHAALEKEVARVRVKRKPGKQSPPDPSRTAQALSADASSCQASIPGVLGVARLKVDPMADVRKSLISETALSEIARVRANPLAEIRKSLASATGLTELASSIRHPMTDIRKSLASTREGLDAAKGLAALMAKTERQKND